MKRRSYTNRKRCTKKRQFKREKKSSIKSLPYELLSEILAKTAASSFTGLFAAKLSCKFFNEVAEDNFVLRKVTMEKSPLRNWWPSWTSRDAANSFWERCLKSSNPEALYIQGVIDYFGYKRREESGLMLLDEAATLGNIEARYALGLIRLLSEDEGDIKKGLQILGDLERSNVSLKECREKLENVVGRIFRTDKFRNKVHRYCSTRENHGRRSGWSGDEDDIQCNACRCEREVQYFCECL